MKGLRHDKGMTRPGDGFLGVAGSAGRGEGGYRGASRGGQSQRDRLS